MSHFLFEEEQKFTRLVWMWILSILGVLLPLTIILTLDRQALSASLLILTLFSTAIPFAILMLWCRMSVRVDEAGLQYRFVPSVFQWKTISPEEIVSYEIREPKNWYEKFSVGFRRSLLRDTTFINITGKKFLVVTLRNKGTLMIGTENAESLAWAMKRMTSK